MDLAKLKERLFGERDAPDGLPNVPVADYEVIPVDADASNPKYKKGEKP